MEDKLTILIKNGNVAQLQGAIDVQRKLYKAFQIKHPNAWHIQMYKKTHWDGTVKFISASGVFKTGLLGLVYNKALTYTKDVEIIDKRYKPYGDLKPIIPDKVGKLTLYDNQKEALKKILFHKVGNIPFQIVSSSLPVGFGKTLIFTALHKAYKGKLNTLLLLNDSDLFNQFKREIPELIDDEPVTFIQGGKVTHWTKFNVGMVQSIKQNISKYQHNLAQIDMLLIDESDVIDNNTYKSVIETLYNTTIRVGLSGTLYKGVLKKHELKKMNIRAFIGDPVEHVALSTQMKTGKSTPVIVKMIKLTYPVEKQRSYKEEYDANIVYNNDANKAILSRVKYNLRYERTPLLIVVKFIPHCDGLTKYLRESLKGYKIEGVHHKTPNRTGILEGFRDGKIDILVSSTIVSRGKNMPLLQCIINATSMDAEEKTIQILGRAVRKHKTKTKAYLDDLMFPGKYLGRHGKHRKNYYLRENMKVIMLPRDVKQRKRVKAKNKKK